MVRDGVLALEERGGELKEARSELRGREEEVVARDPMACITVAAIVVPGPVQVHLSVVSA